jgi:hypothetical protein
MNTDNFNCCGEENINTIINHKINEEIETQETQETQEIENYYDNILLSNNNILENSEINYTIGYITIDNKDLYIKEITISGYDKLYFLKDIKYCFSSNGFGHFSLKSNYIFSSNDKKTYNIIITCLLSNNKEISESFTLNKISENKSRYDIILTNTNIKINTTYKEKISDILIENIINKDDNNIYLSGDNCELFYVKDNYLMSNYIFNTCGNYYITINCGDISKRFVLCVFNDNDYNIINNIELTNTTISENYTYDDVMCYVINKMDTYVNIDIISDYFELRTVDNKKYLKIIKKPKDDFIEVTIKINYKDNVIYKNFIINIFLDYIFFEDLIQISYNDEENTLWCLNNDNTILRNGNKDNKDTLFKFINPYDKICNFIEYGENINYLYNFSNNKYLNLNMKTRTLTDCSVNNNTYPMIIRFKKNKNDNKNSKYIRNGDEIIFAIRLDNANRCGEYGCFVLTNFGEKLFISDSNSESSYIIKKTF